MAGAATSSAMSLRLNAARYPARARLLNVWTPSSVVSTYRGGHRGRVCCSPKSKDTLRQSFDSEDELDGELAQELQSVADPERLKKLAKHFELAWKINRPGRPTTCDCCNGRKEEECQWCHGTGYLTVGTQLFPSTTNHASNCPVCKGTGYLKCERCRGTGFRATWLPSGTDLLP